MLNQEVYKKQSNAIWGIANLLQEAYRPPQYRQVMIPFTVLRRLVCVLETSKEAVLTGYGQFDKMKTVNRKAIKHYEEYCSALITTAITVKIDRRNIKRPKQELI